MVRESLLKSLSEEQLEKARSCKSNAEILELAKEEGIELTEEQLNEVNGGCADKNELYHCDCPACQSSNTFFDYYDESDNEIRYICRNCGHIWEAKLFPGR